jgi:hypothetical protein
MGASRPAQTCKEARPPGLISCTSSRMRGAAESAKAIGISMPAKTSPQHRSRANAENDFDAAFATFSREGTGALLVCASPFFNTRREQLVVLAARHALPGMYEWRDFAADGGLMSYGTSLREAYRQAGASGTLRRIRCNAQIRELSEVQRTCHELVGPIGPALMTHLGHERASFAVMHNAAFPTTIW